MAVFALLVATNRPLSIADNLSRAGWTWGYVSYIEAVGFKIRKIWVVDAYRTDGPRIVVHADDILTTFLEIEAQCKTAVGSPAK